MNQRTKNVPKDQKCTNGPEMYQRTKGPEMYQRTRNAPKYHPDYDWKQADHIGFGSKTFNIATTEIWAFYFYTIHTEQYDWIRNPFATNAENSTEALSLQIWEEFLDLRNEGTLKLKFTEVPLDVFWIVVKDEYPQISDKAIAVLLPFSTTYLCEQLFSTLVLIKNDKRSCLKGLDQKLALSNIEPNIKLLCSLKRAQVSYLL